MKLRYLFSIILSSALLFAGCTKDEPTDSFDNFKLSETYLSISEEGGTAVLTVNSDKDWSFMETDPNDKDYKWPSWLTADKMSGAAGETVVTLSAEKSDAGREAEIKIKNGNLMQFFRVRQGSMTPVSATCKEVIDGPDGKTFRVKGVCTSIANTLYGNWYLNDGTGEVYIYGTLDSEGQDKNFASWNLEVGDVIEVEGPKTTYGTTIELVNVTVIKIEKALLKLPVESAQVEKEGATLEFKVAYKGNGVFNKVSEDSREWLSVVDMDYIPGTPSKLEPNPADTAVLKINVLPNDGAIRTGKIFVTSNMAEFDGDEAEISSTEGVFTVTQKGNVLTVEDGYYGFVAENAGKYYSASPLAADKKYGYINANNADVLESLPSTDLFKLTAVEGGYTIQDPSGRYYYQQGTYDNFNVSTTAPKEGHVWTLYSAGEAVKVVNALTGKTIQFDPAYGNWGAYAETKGLLPVLMSAVPATIANGKYYIKVEGSGVNGVATPLTGNYGYINLSSDVVEANAFTFTYAYPNGYTIADPEGKKYYQTGTYNNFNRGPAPKEGQYWSIEKLADGKYEIMNLSVNKWWQYSVKYKSFGSYNSAQNNALMPVLVPLEGSSDEGGNEGGNQGGNDGALTNPFTSNVNFEGVASAYTDGIANVNGTEGIKTLKLGSSKVNGEGKITLPAGTKTLKFYAVAWKGNACKLEFSMGGLVIATQAIAANDGATNVAPYTITVTASDCYTLTFNSALTAETDLTVKTVDKPRAILFGINASK